MAACEVADNVGRLRLAYWSDSTEVTRDGSGMPSRVLGPVLLDGIQRIEMMRNMFGRKQWLGFESDCCRFTT